MINLTNARKKDLETVLKLSSRFHQREGTKHHHAKVQSALFTLLKKNSEHGCVWLVYEDKQLIGYIALCLGFRLSLGGQDAFIDELFIENDYWNPKLGQHLVQAIKEKAQKLALKSLRIQISDGNQHIGHSFEKQGLAVVPQNKRTIYKL